MQCYIKSLSTFLEIQTRSAIKVFMLPIDGLNISGSVSGIVLTANASIYMADQF